MEAGRKAKNKSRKTPHPSLRSTNEVTLTRLGNADLDKLDRWIDNLLDAESLEAVLDRKA